MVLKIGSKSEDAKRLQAGLNFLGFKSGTADGNFGHLTELAVVAFQTRYKLYADGIAGPSTLKTYNKVLKAAGGVAEVTYGLVVEVPAPLSPPPTEDVLLAWEKCRADIAPGSGGYNHLTLRADTAAAYQKVYDEVRRLGGLLTTAGGKRSLSAAMSSSRSQTSFHYTGRAFDLATDTGMQHPLKDPYLVVRNTAPDGSRMWTVWCRSTMPLATLLNLAPATVPCVSLIENVTKVVTKKGAKGKPYTQILTEPVLADAFNLTALLARNGFLPISGRLSFFQGGEYGGAEWWHFQNVLGLTVGVSTFGKELRRVYSEAECQKLPQWDEVKDRQYGVSWF